MIKKEAQFTKKFGTWLNAHGARLQSCAWECKSSRGKDSIPFAEISVHQRNALLACTTKKGFHFKLPDTSYSFLPFDGFFFRNSPAYLILSYPKNFYIVSIQTFIEEEKRSKRKSLTEARAKEISIISSK